MEFSQFIGWIPYGMGVSKISNALDRYRWVIEHIRRYRKHIMVILLIVGSITLYWRINASCPKTNEASSNLWVYHENNNSSLFEKQRITLDPIPSELSCYITLFPSQNITVSIPGEANFVEQAPDPFPENFNVSRSETHRTVLVNESLLLNSCLTYHSESAITLWRCRVGNMIENKTFPIRVKWLECISKLNYHTFTLFLPGNGLGFNDDLGSIIGMKADKIRFEFSLRFPYRIDKGDPEWDFSDAKRGIIDNKTDVVARVYKWDCSGRKIDIEFSSPRMENDQNTISMIASGLFGFALGLPFNPSLGDSRKGSDTSIKTNSLFLLMRVRRVI